MRSKLFGFLGLIMCVVFALAAFAGCGDKVPAGDNGGDKPNGGITDGGAQSHTHDFTGDYMKEGNYHWHVCKVEGCTETDAKQAHVYGADGLCVCGAKNPVKPVQMAWSNALNDPSFNNGFGVMGQRDGNSRVYGYLRPEDYTSGKATWVMAQWYSGYYHMPNHDTFTEYPAEYNILNSERVVDGTKVSYTDASKTFAFDNATGEIYMELNASNEYTAPRASGGPWPHLLVQYTLEETRLSKIDGLQINLDYRLDKIENKMSDSEYNSGLHAAQLVWYIVVKNCNENSADNGKYIWFGINMYDNRNTSLSQQDSYMIDLGSEDKIGTGAPIYGVANGKTHTELPSVGKDISISIDIYDIIQDAFNTAVKQGYLTKSKWTDMYVTDGNCGWELPGTFDCATTITKFEINTGKIVTE